LRSGGGAAGVRGTRGGSSQGSGEQALVSQVLEELHDFRHEGGGCASDWVLQVLRWGPGFRV